MTSAELTAEAEKVVVATQRKLPGELRELARALPVVYHDWPSDEILGEEFDPDILGMFVGNARHESSGEGNPVPSHILLFVENLYDFAEEDLQVYRDEVRVTYLHELGHYFGWDEDELEARGLE